MSNNERAAFEAAFDWKSLDERQRTITEGSCYGAFVKGYRAHTDDHTDAVVGAFNKGFAAGERSGARKAEDALRSVMYSLSAAIGFLYPSRKIPTEEFSAQVGEARVKYHAVLDLLADEAEDPDAVGNMPPEEIDKIVEETVQWISNAELKAAEQRKGPESFTSVGSWSAYYLPKKAAAAEDNQEEIPQLGNQLLTPEEIDKIAESMPGGLDGFLKGWGWRQFAAAVETETLRRRDDLIQKLALAVVMVGNLDTPEDKAQWWSNFRTTFEIASETLSMESIGNFVDPDPKEVKQQAPDSGFQEILQEVLEDINAMSVDELRAIHESHRNGDIAIALRDLNKISALKSPVVFKSIRTEEDYAVMVALANTLADRLDGTGSGPVHDTFAIVTDLIEVWETHHPCILDKDERKDALEEAAIICEQLSAEFGEQNRTRTRVVAAAMQGALTCAAAIRARKDGK